MMELAVQGGNFIHCLIHNARPFRVCKTCVKHYTRFTTLYSKLQENDTCSGMLLKADRIQVITSVYTMVTSTWSTAFCDLCFDSVEENFTTGQVTFNYTADTILFEEMEEHLSTCISNYSHTVDPTDNMTEVCRECRPIYRQMTSHFSAVKKRTKGCVCQDIVDMMNSTWFMWGTRFRCPRPQVSASSVIVISSVFVIITILLYSMSKAVTKIPRPQILKPKRMKRYQQRRYGAISLTGDSEECPLVAAAHIQGVYRQRNH
ncbi:osteopetrosis-associated transmembrane protein 1-like [Babylonia areolata]|uniref:osteopetrosis-associated transmembrane protein 1-like n=1 Tax=Babylonia areolata TaxID=304850 RepID=UPI003FD391EF